MRQGGTHNVHIHIINHDMSMMLLHVDLKCKLRISGYPQVSQLLYEILYVHDASLYVPQTQTSRQGDFYKINIHNRRYFMAMVLLPVYLEPEFCIMGYLQGSQSYCNTFHGKDALSCVLH